jgi:hypothetical protein
MCEQQMHGNVKVSTALVHFLHCTTAMLLLCMNRRTEHRHGLVLADVHVQCWTTITHMTAVLVKSVYSVASRCCL